MTGKKEKVTLKIQNRDKELISQLWKSIGMTSMLDLSESSLVRHCMHPRI